MIFFREVVSQLYEEMSKVELRNKRKYIRCKYILIMDSMIAVLSELLLWTVVIEDFNVKILYFVSGFIFITAITSVVILGDCMKKSYNIWLNSVTYLQGIQEEAYYFILGINEYEMLNAAKRQLLFEERFAELNAENRQVLTKIHLNI